MSVHEDHNGYSSFENPRPAPKPIRLTRTTPEKHEGYSTSSTDRFRFEDTNFRAEKERLEAGLKYRISPQDTTAARELPSPLKLSGPESRERAKPKRPSMLRRFFTSPTRRSPTDGKGYASATSYNSDEDEVVQNDPFDRRFLDLEYIPQARPKDDQYQHAQASAAKALQAWYSRIRSEAKHKRSSNRRESLEAPARSGSKVDDPAHGEVNRQTSKNDFRMKGLPMPSTYYERRQYIGDSDSLDGMTTPPFPMPNTITIKSISSVALVDPEEIRVRSSNHEPVLLREPEVQPSALGWTENHLVLGPTDEDILVSVNPLGHGSLGVVEEVRRIGGQFPTLVRKRVNLPLQKRKAAAYLKIVQEEARILRLLVHPHIVTLVGSYEDMKQFRRPSYCLLMSPVGENDLEAFLTIVGEHEVSSEFSVRWRSCIRNWMACLASALEYMHATGIRHQDIKPSNIIRKGDHVFFTDFSSSSFFKIGHTTSTENPTRSTPMYGAPEVTSDRGKHGRTTDIFSLGCVFSDMLSVVEGRTVLSFQDYLRNNGQLAATDATPLPRALSYSEKIPVINNWFADSHIFNSHVSQMLQPDRKMRPTANEVLQAFILNEVCDVSCSCLRAEIL